MKKTVYMQPDLAASEFAQGFLSSSEWVRVSNEWEANVLIQWINEGIRCTLKKDMRVNKMRINNSYIFMSASDKSYDLLVDSTLAFSKYVVPDNETPHSKLIYEQWNKQNLCEKSEFAIGEAFGIFAADAINEEDYLETKTGANAKVSIFDECLFEEKDVQKIHYEETIIPYEEAQHMTFCVRED